ncbi:hypothetical protein QTN25_003977 [Entamoeba marina]
MPRNILLFFTSFALANISLIIGTVLTKLNVITSRSSRKIVHIMFGFSQVMLWGFYEPTTTARIWGNLGYFIFTLGFLIFGCGCCQGKLFDFIVTCICRTGDYREFLYGPF